MAASLKTQVKRLFWPLWLRQQSEYDNKSVLIQRDLLAPNVYGKKYLGSSKSGGQNSYGDCEFVYGGGCAVDR